MDARDLSAEVSPAAAGVDVEGMELLTEYDDQEAHAQRAAAGAAGDGDGAMLGRVLVYASIVVVTVAMIIWKRSV